MEKAIILANEIRNMKIKINELEQRLIHKNNELERICPHEKTIEEYDDDFNNPCFYNICLTCGQESNIKYNR